MAFSDLYRRQVALLLRTLPHVSQEDCFALKGGTAINLFIRDMPRLSVDIDLTYLPVGGRKESLNEIDASMKRIAGRLKRLLPRAHVTMSALRPESAVVKLLVRDEGVQVKIEVTPVLRGCVYEPELRSVSPAVEDAFGFAETRVVSFADLYAGKVVAALDRQHPRDLFDVRDLLANEGVDDTLRRAFLIYLVSHNRPMAEILNPKRKDIAEEFQRGLLGMTAEPVGAADLLRAREQLITQVVTDMPQAHRRFLLSFERGDPAWDEIGISGAENLPAVRWRQQNLNAVASSERARLVDELEKALSADGSITAPSGA